MLIIENLYYSDQQNENKFKIPYAKFNLGDSVEIIANDETCDIFINYLLGDLVIDDAKLSYNEDRVFLDKSKAIALGLQKVNFLYNELTLKENIFYFTRLLKVSKPVIQNKINWLLHFFEIYSSLDKKVEKCSDEELLIIHFLFSLINIPKILILNYNLPKNMNLFNVEKYQQLFQDIQNTGTIIFYKKEWSTYFKDHKTELVLNPF